MEVAKLASIGAKRRVIKVKMRPPPSEVNSVKMTVVSVEEEDDGGFDLAFAFNFGAFIAIAAVHEECRSAPKMKRNISH
jgi:hypothetical protein